MGRDFNNIKAWQHADDLSVLVYSKTMSFPKEELYGITSQLRRAVVSVPANIAEGSSREHKREYLHFLYIARGSIAETEYLLHLSKRLGYLQDDNYKEVENLRKTDFEYSQKLQGIITRINSV